jgi:hypothetical protein
MALIFEYPMLLYAATFLYPRILGADLFLPFFICIYDIESAAV